MRVNAILIRSLVALTLLGGSAPAWAQAQPQRYDGPKRPAPLVEYRKKTVYDFDEDQVIGTLKRPDGELLFSVRRSPQGPLFHPRQSFVAEIIHSAER